MPPQSSIDSGTLGDPSRFLTLDQLEAGLAGIPNVATHVGQLSLIVRRGHGGLREFVASAHFNPAEGLPGDAWGQEFEPNPDAQLAVMQTGVAQLIANGQSLALFGDQLFLDFNLDSASLPVGAALQIGNATLVVSPMPHNGCQKFRARFGDDALRFVSRPETRHRNLRGVYFRVTSPGTMTVGDPIQLQ